MLKTTKQAISNAIANQVEIDKLATKAKTVQGAEFLYVQPDSKADLETTVDALLISAGADLTMRNFILQADAKVMLEFPKKYAKEAKSLGFTDAQVKAKLDSFMQAVKDARSKLSKKATFLPFENEKSCLRMKKGTLEFEFAAWVDNSWVTKAIYAASNPAKQGESTKTETSTSTEKTPEQGNIDTIDEIMVLAQNLTAEDIFVLQARLDKLMQIKQAQTA